MRLLKDKSINLSEFDWRADPRYQAAATKLIELDTSRERLQRDLSGAQIRVTSAQAEVDRLQLAVLAGQASEADLARAEDECRAAIRDRDVLVADLARVERLLPGLSRIEHELARTTRQPYARKLHTAYLEEVRKLAASLRQAAEASARVKALHDLAVLNFETKDFSFHSDVAGVPLAQWPELNTQDPYSRLSMWIEELSRYGML